jgi:predicted ATPase
VAWPAPLSSFVGRRDELDALAEIAARERLVTVLGAPGIGKTRLVLEWLRAHGEAWSGGARFCELADATSADDVVRFAAKTLRVSLAGEGGAAIEQVGGAIAALGRTALVLDNFEHVLEVAHPIVSAWLRAAPEALVVVTSRERLKIDGERVLELGALASSVDLFVERARDVVRGYALSEDEAPIVSRLVEELDGNPLAIELAAARTRVLSPQEILERLPSRFEVLVSERRDNPRRSSLVVAIDESWRLLSDWGRAALAQCSVFRGGFTLRAAESVLALPSGAPSVVDAIEALCDKSLVAVRDQRRFALHASIRAYAEERLGELGATEATRDRHAACYATSALAWSERLRGEDAARATSELRADTENLASALRCLLSREPSAEGANRALAIAAALAPILGLDGPYPLRAWALEQAIAFADRTTADRTLLALALDASVLALVAVGRADASRANAERACELAEPLGNALHGRVMSTLGLSYGMQGKKEEAARCLERAIGELRDADERLDEGRVLGRLAWLEWSTGALEAARERFRAALALHRETKDRTFEAMNGGYLAVILHELGDLDAPEELLESALAEHRKTGHRRFEAEVLAALSALMHEKGRLDDARAIQTKALEMYRALGHRRDQAALLVDIARLAFDAGATERARAAYEEALPIARATQNAIAVADAEAGLAVIAAKEGRLDDARAGFARAEEAAIPGPRGTGLVAVMKVHLDIAEGKDIGALPKGIGREGRIAVAGIARVLDHAHAHDHAHDHDHDHDLVLERTARIVRTAEGAIALEKNPALFRIVACFVDTHAHEPGKTIAIDTLIAAGWPEEKVRSDAGARRVFTALSTLRKRGLRDFILKRDDGYCLAPGTRVAVR